MDEQIQSRATQVTFFEDRAQVTRHAQVALEIGRHTIIVGGVTMLLADASLIVRIVDGADRGRILTSRVHRTLETKKQVSDAEIARLEANCSELAKELERRRRELTRCGARHERTKALDATLVEHMSTAPRGSNPDDWKASLDRLNAEYDEVENEYAEAVEAVAEARRSESRAALLLTQARVEKPELSAQLEIELEISGAGEFELEFEYFTPCALWRPSHIARLSENRDSVELRMLGTVWQQTGENWKSIQCRFSTARPTRAAEAPLITDDWLRARPKTDEERRIVSVEARDVDIASTGSELAGQVEQMPGVDDGGEPLTLEATEVVSIPSNGEPFRVEIQSVTVPCRTDIVAYPEKSTVPFLRARGTWTDQTPILAGPVVVMRGNEYAGRSRIDFVTSGETFELGFGVESGISVHRTIEDEHKTTAVTGKNVLHRTVKVFLSNLSGQTHHLTVVERVPVSEIEEVSVKKISASTSPDTDGFVEFGVKLAPQAVETETLSYRVEYGSKVRLSW